MSDHQPEHHDDGQQAKAEPKSAPDTAADPHEPDFSRLRLARARLDNAFPAE